MDKSFTAAVEGAGGTVGDHIATPFPNDNFATYITKAAADKPDVIGTMHAGGDLINFVKQYNQAGISDQIKLAVGLMFITDIHSLGAEQFKGVTFTEAWYWNFDEQNSSLAVDWKRSATVKPGIPASSWNASDHPESPLFAES